MLMSRAKASGFVATLQTNNVEYNNCLVKLNYYLHIFIGRFVVKTQSALLFPAYL